MNPCRAIAQGRAATLAAWGRGGGVGENIATCRWARAMGSAAPERYDWLWRRQRQRQARCGGPGRARSVRTRRAGRRRSGGRAGRAGGPGRGRDGTVTGVPLWWIGGWAKYLTHVEWSRITGDGGWGGGGGGVARGDLCRQRGSKPYWTEMICLGPLYFGWQRCRWKKISQQISTVAHSRPTPHAL